MGLEKALFDWLSESPRNIVPDDYFGNHMNGQSGLFNPRLFNQDYSTLFLNPPIK